LTTSADRRRPCGNQWIQRRRLFPPPPFQL